MPDHDRTERLAPAEGPEPAPQTEPALEAEPELEPAQSIAKPERWWSWTALITGVLLFAAAGTGITVAATTHYAPGAGHYTFADNPDTNPLADFTIFDWTSDGHGTVTGTFRAVDPADPTNNFSQDFTGVQDGTALVLVIVTPSGRTTLKGKMTSSTLRFRDAGGGAMSLLTLRKTTPAEFDRAVRVYKSRHPTVGAATSL